MSGLPKKEAGLPAGFNIAQGSSLQQERGSHSTAPAEGINGHDPLNCCDSNLTLGTQQSQHLTVDFSLLSDVLPAEMLQAPRWLVWRYVPNGSKKPKKIPYYTSGRPRRTTDTPSDARNLATFEAAKAAIEAGGSWDGIGFALGPDGTGKFWQGVDLDNMSGRSWLQYAYDNLAGYVEKSPSGNGWHSVGYGKDLTTVAPNDSGIEVYSKGRYFTVTGDKAGGELCDLAGLVAGFLTPLIEKHGRPFTQETQESAHLQKRAEEGRRDLKRSEEDRRDLKQGGEGDTESQNPPVFQIPKDALKRILPTGEGQRNRKVFDLARYCAGKHPDASTDALKPIVRQWHEAALPVIGTKGFMETWIDFCTGLKKVKHPMGETMNEIVGQVAVPTEVPAEHEDLGLSGYHLLLICAALQDANGEEPFFLSYRTAGELIGRHFTDAGKLLKGMVMENYLEEAKKGDTHKATRYRLLRRP